MAAMTPIAALILCAIATSCAGNTDEKPVESRPTASESDTSPPAAPECTTTLFSECIVVWVDGRAVSVGKDSTDIGFGYEDAPVAYSLGFPPGHFVGDRMKLPSGYEPQTSRSGTGLYFDYVLTRPLEPGSDRQPYRLRGLDYSRRWVDSPRFTPLTTVSEIRAAMGTGKLERVDNDRTPYWSQSDTVHLFTPTG